MTGQPSPKRSSQTPKPKQATPKDGPKQPPWIPPVLRSIDETGLNMLYIADLVIKVLYFRGFMSGQQIADVIRLPYTSIVDRAVEYLKREKFIEVKGAAGVGSAAYDYVISDKGSLRAREVLERSTYAGPCPVTLPQYIDSINAQNQERISINHSTVQQALAQYVFPEELLFKVGPAINSGTSVFLYGPPGNGKTTIAEAVARLVLGRDLWIPYAIDVDGQIIRVFDEVNHEVIEAAPDENAERTTATGLKRDPRWVRIRRPVIMVGGELTLSGLDLVYDPINKFYEAPFQVKANGGMFLIDDFGRQQVRAATLLNRWIVPLEKRVDFLTLATGRKLEVPFHVMIVFSTNMDPADLVDDAFLRRIRYKIEVGDPTYEEFREIFRRVCESTRIPFDDKGLAYLLQEWFIKKDRSLRAVHPRDLLGQLVDIARYMNRPPKLTKDLIDRAAESYFVQLS